VIEDSEVGIAAAQNAGMAVWRFVGGSHLKNNADILVDAQAGVPLFASMEDVATALSGD
jgi:beta-phosphoglucomutase-like phosphatase (HAD superfamily)